MKKTLVVNETSAGKDEKQTFLDDVFIGLSLPKKQIPSKYFYDERGSELFNQITRHSDYYLTGCELEILTRYKEELATLFGETPFNLIELGPGEAIKTRILIDQFRTEHLPFSYFTIDISKKYLTQIIEQFHLQLPDLETIALNMDYLTGIKWLNVNSQKRNVVLFLGSSIGNFNLNASREFLAKMHDFLNPGDYVLLGFDLLKDISILQAAYNDRDGITREFNLNLLQRMNRELGANFIIDRFYHYSTYNVYAQAMESYLISNKEQNVDIARLESSFYFKEFEAIHVESSQKYTLAHIANLAQATQFTVIKNYCDHNHYFVNSLWQVKQD